LINEVRGAYRGVAFGDTRHQVVRKLGRPPVGPDGRHGVPLVNGDEHRAQQTNEPLINGKPPQYQFMGYPDVGISLVGPQHSSDPAVSFLKVGRDGASTNRGVAIGDSLDEAESAYPEIDCATANEGTEYATYPFCAGELRPGRNIWFGGDPIDIIELDIHTFPNAPASIEERRRKTAG
jgi:hypothetical protein